MTPTEKLCLQIQLHGRADAFASTCSRQVGDYAARPELLTVDLALTLVCALAAAKSTEQTLDIDSAIEVARGLFSRQFADL